MIPFEMKPAHEFLSFEENITSSSFILSKSTNELRSIQSPSDGDIVIVSGFYTEGDTIASHFIYASNSTLEHDGGMVIDPLAPSPLNDLSAFLSYQSVSNGRWIRKTGITIPVEWYGAKRNDETFDNSASFIKALNSVHTNGKEIIVDVGYYVVDNTITISRSYSVLRGNNNSTAIVGMKREGEDNGVYPLISIRPGANYCIIKDLTLKPWNYPSKGEPGWTDRFKEIIGGQTAYADTVATIDRGLNGGDETFHELDLTDPDTLALFPSHWYRTSSTPLVTKDLISIGGLITSDGNLFQTTYATIDIAETQVNPISVVITPNLPNGFVYSEWVPILRIVQENSVFKGNNTIPDNDLAILPTDFPSGAGLEIDIYADIVYNYDGTFTVTFTFPSGIPSNDFSPITGSPALNGAEDVYTMPIALDLYKLNVGTTLDNLTLDGMWYAGPADVDSTGTNTIGFGNCISLLAVRDTVINGCLVSNYYNDAISMKSILNSWSPSIQRNPMNSGVQLVHSTFQRGGKSGVDVEGDTIFIDKCVFKDIYSVGTLRFGSRAMGVQHKSFTVRDTTCIMDPKSSLCAVIVCRYFGSSDLDKLLLDNCIFSTSSYVDTSTNSLSGFLFYSAPSDVTLKNVTFDGMYRPFLVSDNCTNITLTECQYRNNAKQNNNHMITINSGVTVFGQIAFNNCYYERTDDYTSFLMGGFGDLDNYSSKLKYDILLSSTATLPESIIRFDLVRDTINQIGTVPKTIIQGREVFEAWATNVASLSNCSNVVVDTTSQSYIYGDRRIYFKFKLTLDNAQTTFNFNFDMPPIPKLNNDVYATTALIEGQQSSLGTVQIIGNQTVRVRQRADNIGTGKTMFVSGSYPY